MEVVAADGSRTQVLEAAWVWIASRLFGFHHARQGRRIRRLAQSIRHVKHRRRFRSIFLLRQTEMLAEIGLLGKSHIVPWAPADWELMAAHSDTEPDTPPPVIEGVLRIVSRAW